MDQPATDTLEGIRKVMLQTDADVRMMLSRMLLYCCNNESTMVAKLKKFGFTVPRKIMVKLPFNLLCWDLVGVVAFFVGAACIWVQQMSVGKGNCDCGVGGGQSCNSGSVRSFAKTIVGVC
jgi:hypothetical protein